VKLSHFRCRCQLLCTGCDQKWGGDRDRARAADWEDSEDEREQDKRRESRSKLLSLLERRCKG
jgi:hypothetical protein